MQYTIYAIYQQDANGNWDEVDYSRDWDIAVAKCKSICESEKTPMRIDINTLEIDNHNKQRIIDTEPDAFSISPQSHVKTGYLGDINGLGCEPDVMP